MIQPLEPRRMLASVTVITHGYEPTGEASPWITSLGNAIAARLPGGADVYKIVVSGDGGDLHVASFKPVSVAKDVPRGDAIVLLDWARSSSVNLLGLSATNSTSKVAALVAPLLMQVQDNFGARTTPLAELPIHLIGHSRGGTLVSELAKALGQKGVWVDQQTTLDSRGVPPDPDAKVFSNVIFADNYFEQTDDFPLLDGAKISGATNVDLSDVFSGLSGIGTAHNTVPTFYGGTAALSAGSFSDRSIKSSWYGTSSTGPRNAIGFAYARGGGTTRPANGSRFLGADRSSVSVGASGAARWDDVAFLSLTKPLSVSQGTVVSLDMRIEDVNNDATVVLTLDTDTNPYNGVGTAAELAADLPGHGSGVTQATPRLQTGDLTPGVYYLTATIENGAHTRYEYSQQALTILPAGSTGPTRVLTVVAGKAVKYVDGTGQVVTVKMSGPGTTKVFLPGDVEAADPTLISVEGSTNKSGLTISSKKVTTVPAITLGGAMGTVAAGNVAVTSAVTASGRVHSLTLGSVADGTVTLAGGADAVVITSIARSRVLAGFGPGTSAASGTGDLVDHTVAIKAITVKSGFSDTVIAGGQLLSVKLPAVDAGTNGTVLTTLLGKLYVKGRRVVGGLAGLTVNVVAAVR